MTPIATITNVTATGDVIIGPGAVTKLYKGLPAACMGDAVAGPLCVAGAITMSTAVNKIFMGRPVANLGSLVAGAGPLGIPMSTAVSVCINVNILV
ncbi:MAG: PAAR domain-containing protein [Treponema sp.]|nr:PAAR domain-containing protein [Treponema sp.]